jgi:hypothetical protein
MAAAICLDKPFDLGQRQVLAGAEGSVGGPGEALSEKVAATRRLIASIHDFSRIVG